MERQQGYNHSQSYDPRYDERSYRDDRSGYDRGPPERGYRDDR